MRLNATADEIPGVSIWVFHKEPLKVPLRRRRGAIQKLLLLLPNCLPPFVEPGKAMSRD